MGGGCTAGVKGEVGGWGCTVAVKGEVGGGMYCLCKGRGRCVRDVQLV